MRAQLLRIISAQVFLHASMSGTRMAAPLLALQQGHSPIAIGVLLALFALTQVFLALPAGRWATGWACIGPCTPAWPWPPPAWGWR